jgi:peptidoglycan/xylan/chitin deacetylase (PgdA/CDA1 family)
MKRSVALVFLLGWPALMFGQSSRSRFNWPDGKKVALSLTFDDARLSQIDAGLPLLDRYRTKATFYVVPGTMEQRLAGWKKAAAEGHEIGNHSRTHPCTVNYAFSAANALENYTLSALAKDIDGASAEIERLVGARPVSFAYPCGQKFVGRGAQVASYVPLVAQKFLSGRGFRDEGANDPAACDLAQILGTESDGLSFDQMRTLVAQAAASGGWLVFAGHEMGTGGEQTTQLAALEQLLRYAAEPANGVWVDTVHHVAAYIAAKRPRP